MTLTYLGVSFFFLSYVTNILSYKSGRWLLLTSVGVGSPDCKLVFQFSTFTMAAADAIATTSCVFDGQGSFDDVVDYMRRFPSYGDTLLHYHAGCGKCEFCLMVKERMFYHHNKVFDHSPDPVRPIPYSSWKIANSIVRTWSETTHRWFGQPRDQFEWQWYHEDMERAHLYDPVEEEYWHRIKEELKYLEAVQKWIVAELLNDQQPSKRRKMLC